MYAMKYYSKKFEIHITVSALLSTISNKWDLSHLWVWVLHIGVGWQTLHGVHIRVAECTLNDGEAGRMDHPVVPAQIYSTYENGYLLKCSHMRVDADALHILLRTCHEDLRSQGAALQACVSTMRWHRDCRDWNSVEKENRLRLEERERSAVDPVNVDYN